MRLDGNNIIVTGAGQGIGEQIARLVVALGAKAILIDVKGDKVKALSEELGSTCTEWYVGSVSDPNFVQDTVDGMLALSVCKKAEGHIVNIGSGEEWSIAEIVNILCEILGQSVDIITDDSRVRPVKSEVNRLLADITKLKKLTGWEKSLTFNQGLTKTVNWIQNNMHYYDIDRYTK